MPSIAFRHLLLCGLAVCVSCAEAPEASSTLHLESLQSVQVLLQDPDLQIVDVRTAEEWQGGHLPDSTWVPPRQWANVASRVPADKPLLLVCRSGHRAQKVAQTLVRQGHPEVHVLVDAGVPELLKI